MGVREGGQALRRAGRRAPRESVARYGEPRGPQEPSTRATRPRQHPGTARGPRRRRGGLGHSVGEGVDNPPRGPAAEQAAQAGGSCTTEATATKAGSAVARGAVARPWLGGWVPLRSGAGSGWRADSGSRTARWGDRTTASNRGRAVASGGTDGPNSRGEVRGGAGRAALIPRWAGNGSICAKTQQTA
jgi:hypothetical protein